MKISKVNIKNYKSMRDSKDVIINQDIYALIGQNNTGKSTILDAIQCLYPGERKSVEFKDFHDRSRDVEIEVEFCDVTNDYIIDKMLYEHVEKNKKQLKKMKSDGKSKKEIETKKATQKKNLKKKLEEIINKYEIENEKMVFRLVVPSNGSGSVGKKHCECRSRDNIISEADMKKILPALKVIPAIRNPQNESTAGSNSYMKDLIQMLDDSIQTSIKVGRKKINYNELNNIIAKESNKRCAALSKAITSKYAQSIGNNDFEINITSEVNIGKGTSYTTKLLDKVTNLESDMLNCGTGYQSMIILAILETYVELAKKKDGYILIIEEPEVYLHPKLQRKMIETLMKLSKDNQVLFSTHSAITIAKLKKEQIGLVVKENGEAHIEEIQVKKVISELGIRPDDIMMNKGVILVEGPDDKEVIEHLLDKIDKSARDKISIVYTGSCSNIKFYANAEKLLNTVYDMPLLIIRDADSKTEENQHKCLVEDIKKLMNSTKTKDTNNLEDSIHIIGKHSLESLYMQGNLLSNITKLDVDICDKVVQIYNDVYDYMIRTELTEQQFARIYQPKYFFEKNLDDFGWGDEKASIRQRWDDSYYLKWQKAINKVYSDNGDSLFEQFKLVREKVNMYTAQMAKIKRNYMLEILGNMDMPGLKKGLFAGLVDKLEKFLELI